MCVHAYIVLSMQGKPNLVIRRICHSLFFTTWIRCVIDIFLMLQWFFMYWVKISLTFLKQLVISLKSTYDHIRLKINVFIVFSSRLLKKLYFMHSRHISSIFCTPAPIFVHSLHSTLPSNTKYKDTHTPQ